MIGQMAKGKEGHDSCGEEMAVFAHRLMLYTMIDVFSREFDKEKANKLLRSAGVLAGIAFARSSLALDADFKTFLISLRSVIADIKVGTLRIDSFNPDTGNLVVTAEEDPGSSGWPIPHEKVHIYDEGFIAGILEAYTGEKYSILGT